MWVCLCVCVYVHPLRKYITLSSLSWCLNSTIVNPAHLEQFKVNINYGPCIEWLWWIMISSVCVCVCLCVCVWLNYMKRKIWSLHLHIHVHHNYNTFTWCQREEVKGQRSCQVRSKVMSRGGQSITTYVNCFPVRGVVNNSTCPWSSKVKVIQG